MSAEAPPSNTMGQLAVENEAAIESGSSAMSGRKIRKSHQASKPARRSEKYNTHANIVPDDKTDEFINWINANSEMLGVEADVCKLQKHNKNYDESCDQGTSDGTSSLISFDTTNQGSVR